MLALEVYLAHSILKQVTTKLRLVIKESGYNNKWKQPRFNHIKVRLFDELMKASGSTFNGAVQSVRVGDGRCPQLSLVDIPIMNHHAFPTQKNNLLCQSLFLCS